MSDYEFETGLETAMNWLVESIPFGEKPAKAVIDDIDLSGLIEMAVETAEKRTRRRRALPNATTLWIVVAMSVFRHMSLAQLAYQLGVKGDRGKRLASSSVTEARARLGVAPARTLFEELSMRWSHDAAGGDTWHGLSLYSMDGTTLTVPDSDENDAAFGRPASRDGRAGYPKVRLVALLAVRSRLLVDVAFGPYRGKGTGETSLAASMWDGVPDRSVLLFDRGFTDTGRIHRLLNDGTERHFVTREKKAAKYEVVEALGPGDDLVDIATSQAARTADPTVAPTLRLRRIEYQIDGHEPSVLLTSLLDPKQYTAAEIVDLYHERWSIELVYRDIKVTQLNRLEALRSRTPEGVEQEIWGLLIAYQLVRKRMLMVAQQLDVPASRLSFKTALLAVHAFCLQMTIPLRSEEFLWLPLEVLDGTIATGLMDDLRPERRYPRHVKVKMSKYKRNRGKPGNRSR